MSRASAEGNEARVSDKRARLARLLAEQARAAITSPLSHAQGRLWAVDQITPGTPAYNVVQAFRLDGGLDVGVLRRSLATIVERQASLRTTFNAVEGRAVQVVQPEAGDRLAVVDLGTVAPLEREREALRLVAEKAERPLDLRLGPLFQATLLRLGERDHVLLLVMHHIVSDGWSMGVLLGELTQLYSAYRAGRGSPLRTLPIQYVDFAVWQREREGDDRLQAQLGYWREQLQGATPLELSIGRSRPSVRSFRGRRLPLVLGRGLRDAARSFSKREGLTVFMTLLAAFQALLQRYSGRSDVVVGSPIAGRTRKELEGIIGFFVNPLVMRTDLSGDPSFRELAQRVRRVALGAYANAEVPFDRLVDELEPERSLDRNPVFQVLFVFQNAPAERLDLPGLRVAPLDVGRATSKMDLTLSLEERGEGLAGFVEYSTDLFDASMIERMAEHYEALLLAALSHPDTRLSRLKLLGEGERRRVLVEWNAARGSYPERSIGEVFGEVARARPRAVAVVCGEDRLGYGDLEARSNRLARHLRRRGVGLGRRVGICVDRSLDLVVGLLGIAKAGGAYVPLDPEYPPERLKLLIEDAEVSLVLTQEALRGRVEGGRGPGLVSLDGSSEEIARESGEALRIEAGPDDAAYVAYTSGSTGVPKGVEVRHRGVMRLLFEAGYAAFGAREVFLQLAPLAFDASTLELWGPLLHGGRCVLFPGRVPMARELGEVLRREGVTTLWLTSSLYNAVVDQAPEVLGGLRQLLIGGEALSVAHVRKGLERLEGTQIINGYGPTEGTTFTCCYTIPRELGEVRSIPIGRPISSTQVYVLDQWMEPVPVGVPGELYVGGDGLAGGYLRRPSLTAERFLPDPFGSEPGGRLYRTGDAGMWLEDGRIEFLGRLDDQLKVRGYRIEPGEIEAALRSVHPSVREAAVVARPSPPDGHGRLLACVVGEGPEGFVSPAALRRLLRSKLPEHMIPPDIVWLDALPLTPSGKVDREALARIEPPRPDCDEGRLVEPRTPIEVQLAGLWAEVLGVDRVGVNDNFFEIGGDSILSIQVTARAARKGLRIRPSDLFQHQTVAALARVASTPVPAGAEEAASKGAFPLTPIQRWFFEQSLPEPRHFAQSVLLDVPPVEPALLERALAHLGAHHEALHLRFQGEGGVLRQVSGPAEEPVELRRVELPAVAEGERSAAIDAIAFELASRVDLERGPLLRVALVRTTGGPSQLLLVVHHLAVDGVSWRILIEDLDTACRQLREGGTVRLPPRTTSFLQWAERLERFARAEAGREAGYWLSELSGPSRPLPVDRPDGRRANDFASTRKVTVALCEEETEALLREVPRAEGTRTHEVLLAALAQALGRWTSGPALLVDVEAHGREEVFDGVDLSRTVGWFTALYPLRLPLEGVEDPHRALTLVKEQLRRVPNRGLGYGLLRYQGSDPELRERLASLSRAELSFNYLGQFDRLSAEADHVHLAGTEALRFTARGPRPHLLGVSGCVVGRRLRLEWSYSESLHRRETVESLARAHCEALRGLIAHCQSPGARGHAPSDSPPASLDQASLDRVGGAEREVEAIYPLSPMQQGILFHARIARESPAYFVQIHQVVEGQLDVAAFRRAWAQAVERHAALRTSFTWRGLDEPLQVVRRTIALPFEVHDWTLVPAAERADRLEEWMRHDRERRVDLSGTAAWRVAVLLGPGQAFDHVLSFHHAILDGWSVALLLDEVFACYEAIRTGAAPRKSPPLPFQDYVAWLRARSPTGAEEFWRQELRGFVTATDMRLAATPGAGTVGLSEEGELQLPPDLMAGLQGLARRGRLTLNTLLQGAWALLLGRYGGVEDVVFGATVSGRSAELDGLESAVGIFINTVPVRVKLPRRERVLELLGRMQARQAEMLQHQWSPLADVRRWSEVPEGAPLFESLFLFENYPAVQSLWRRDGALRVVEARGYQDASYPLTVVVVPRDGLRVRIKYDARRFTRGAVDRMLVHYRTLLTAFVERPQALLSELSLLDESEQRRMLGEWNAATAPYPREQSLGELFEAQAQRTPDSVALDFGKEQLRYSDLDQLSNRLARRLRRLDVGLESRVGLCVDRSAAMVVAMLGILKAGGAYVPLDPAYPPDRLEIMVADAGVAVVVTDNPEGLRLPVGVRRVRLDAGWSAFASESPAPLGAPPPSDALAYVVYTSGSTGVPRGVCVTHRAVSRLVLETNYVELGSDDVVAQASTVSFDAATFEIWGALLRGSRLLGIGREVALVPSRLAAELRDRGVTVLFLTTALFNLVARESPQAFGGLRTLLVGGEAADPRSFREVLSSRPPRRVLHVYGPTEATTFATWHLVDTVAEDAATVPIGRPISNTTAHVLDSDLRLTPVGLVGELHLGGDGLARAYLGRPDLTAELFIPDPFGGEAGGRLYRTGDLVRRGSEGSLEFVGRADTQVKLRGFRIELGDIEAALRRHAAVREAVALLREDQPGDRRLVGYVTLEPGKEPTDAELRAWLAEVLPAFMVPSAVVVLPEWPLTTNGKLHRRALPGPAAPGAEVRPPAPTGDAMEEQVGAVWREVLGRELIGLDDNFFDVGGDSLRIVGVLGRLVRWTNEDIPLVELFRHPTVRSLAAYLRGPAETSGEGRQTSRVEKSRRGAIEQLARARGRRPARASEEAIP